MTDERFEALMRDAAHTFRRPPEPDLDEIWAGVERVMPDGSWASHETPLSSTGRRMKIPRWVLSIGAIAATLVVGIALGRMSMKSAPTATPLMTKVATVANDAPSGTYDLETSRYLGQTAALLIALPSEVHDGRTDDQFVGRASELLTRTRLLLDSPAANDAQMRSLLEDLELVLAQIVRLQDAHASRTELDLINRALQQRDVIPRLRTAAADISAN
jgi:hypothetical protein